jgi:hypothetical protein
MIVNFGSSTTGSPAAKLAATNARGTKTAIRRKMWGKNDSIVLKAVLLALTERVLKKPPGKRLDED